MIPNRIVPALVALLFICSAAPAFAQDDIAAHRFCSSCGMDRKAYGFSRMLILNADGSVTGVCSLHCAIKEISSSKGGTVKSVLVADRDTRDLINAETAVWVMGGSKRGVMTQVPKWAFSAKQPAEAFIARYGGTICAWEEILAAARGED